MKQNTLFSVLFLVSTGCLSNEPAQRAVTSDALEAPVADECAAVTMAALDDVYAATSAGLVNAELDVIAGVPEMISAEGARESFANALTKLDAFYGWMTYESGDLDPGFVNANEAAVAGQVMWAIAADLQQAVHWAAVSAIDNISDNAKASMEDAFLAIELAQSVEVHGQRCYVDTQMP